VARLLLDVKMQSAKESRASRRTDDQTLGEGLGLFPCSPSLALVSVKDSDGEKLQALVSSCQCNAKTIRNLVATLRMMWNSARAWGYVAHDPFDWLALPKRGLVQRFTLSLDQIRRILTVRRPSG